MLQQTTVAAVIPYFERFLNRFPSISTLAAANESDVLRLWEGLGYYSRARNLHKAAKIVVEQYHGVFPQQLETIQLLPGIGRYTAGAIASFAYDQRAPIVEANTLRLYCRLLGFEGDPRSQDGQKKLWQFAESILPHTSPGRINQALMELGATVCAPREPDCAQCPVAVHCMAFRIGAQGTIPRPKARPVITELTEVSIAIQKGSEYLLRKRASGERWAGLWDFVRFEVPGFDQLSNLGQLIEWIRVESGLSVELGSLVTEFRHSVTRYRISLRCFKARRIAGRLKSGVEWKWVNSDDFDEYPLSVTGRQFADRLK